MKDVSANLSQIRSVNGGLEIARNTPASRGGEMGGPAFREQLESLRDTFATPTAPAAVAPSALKFSNHAVDRMRSRGLSFSPDQMAKIESAVQKAASKGAKESLLLTDEAALIVSVKDKTVVTVMDKTSLKENVFTNIDSAVMI
jgi:flagellar operon protein